MKDKLIAAFKKVVDLVDNPKSIRISVHPDATESIIVGVLYTINIINLNLTNLKKEYKIFYRSVVADLTKKEYDDLLLYATNRLTILMRPSIPIPDKLHIAELDYFLEPDSIGFLPGASTAKPKPNKKRRTIKQLFKGGPR